MLTIAKVCLLFRYTYILKLSQFAVLLGGPKAGSTLSNFSSICVFMFDNLSVSVIDEHNVRRVWCFPFGWKTSITNSGIDGIVRHNGAMESDWSRDNVL